MTSPDLVNPLTDQRVVDEADGELANLAHILLDTFLLIVGLLRVGQNERDTHPSLPHAHLICNGKEVAFEMQMCARAFVVVTKEHVTNIRYSVCLGRAGLHFLS